MNNSKGKLFLIPTTLGEIDPISTIPAAVYAIINEIDEYLVENEKWARQYLKKLGIKKPLQEITLHVLDKHTDFNELKNTMLCLDNGKNLGVISEAGCPGIADPGAEAVKWAHQKNIQVIPLVGPSSILLALMASGFNGQSFAFQGYLPIDRAERIKKIKQLESFVYSQNQTQIFIETPYRNNHLLEDLLKHCQAQILLCIAVDLTLPSESVKTRTIDGWKKQAPNLHKRPAIFLLYK
jgi:16S rRNA (cytidine1402-2'-O)-methyltransferase